MKIKWKRAVSIILVMTLMVTFAQWSNLVICQDDF